MRLRLGDHDVDLAAARDLSLPIRFDQGAARAFSLPPSTTKAVEGGSFVGDTRRGGSCNCETHVITPHGDGTHTEGPGHILKTRRPVVVDDVVCVAVVVRVAPLLLGDSIDDVAGNHRHDDHVIDKGVLEDAWARVSSTGLDVRALIVATDDGKKRRTQTHSTTNPPYLTPDATAWVRERGIDHLLVDLPSLDREDDGGLLSAHHAFFDIAPGADDVSVKNRSVTELIAVDADVTEGVYALFLQVAPFEADAAPSRPVIAPLRKGTA